jgi:hypothetical protein
MKNNRLIIEHNPSPFTGGFRQDEKESMRCTSIKRAKEITMRRAKSSVKSAIFKKDNICYDPLTGNLVNLK